MCLGLLTMGAFAVDEEGAEILLENYIKEGFSWNGYDEWKTYKIMEYERGRIVYLGTNNG